MPIRDDLVLRTIESLAAVLARLVRGGGAAAVADAGAVLDEAYRVHLGTTGAVVRGLDADQLVAVISSTGRLDGGRAYLTGALLEVDAAMHADRDVDGPADRAAVLRVRALDLYAEAGAGGVDELDLAERVRRVRATLLEHVLPEATYARLLAYRTEAGAYAVAEDLLFEWLDEHGASDRVMRDGERFYDHLQGLDDAALAAGDLPRDEIDDGRRGFHTAAERRGVGRAASPGER